FVPSTTHLVPSTSLAFGVVCSRTYWCRLAKRTRASLLEVKRVLLQRIKRNHGERFFMRRREHEGCRDTGRERFAPGGGAHTPSIAGLETGKTEFRRGRN